MSASITLVGRAVSDPAAVFYESGAVRVTLTMTVNRRRFNEASEPFHLEIWGHTAQRAYDEVRAGALLGVIGEIRIREGQPWVLVDRIERFDDPQPPVAAIATAAAKEVA